VAEAAAIQIAARVEIRRLHSARAGGAQHRAEAALAAQQPQQYMDLTAHCKRCAVMKLTAITGQAKVLLRNLLDCRDMRPQRRHVAVIRSLDPRRATVKRPDLHASHRCGYASASRPSAPGGPLLDSGYVVLRTR